MLFLGLVCCKFPCFSILCQSFQLSVQPASNIQVSIFSKFSLDNPSLGNPLQDVRIGISVRSLLFPRICPLGSCPIRFSFTDTDNVLHIFSVIRLSALTTVI